MSRRPLTQWQIALCDFKSNTRARRRLSYVEPMWRKVKAWAGALKRDAIALSMAAGHERTPWYAKVLAAAIVAYALSPIDLIPDFIPVLGYLDDVILVPVGIWVAIKLIPDEVMDECRARAATPAEQPASLGGAIMMVCIWLALAGAGALMIYRALGLSQ